MGLSDIVTLIFFNFVLFIRVCNGILNSQVYIFYCSITYIWCYIHTYIYTIFYESCVINKYVTRSSWFWVVKCNDHLNRFCLVSMTIKIALTFHSPYSTNTRLLWQRKYIVQKITSRIMSHYWETTAKIQILCAIDIFKIVAYLF